MRLVSITVSMAGGVALWVLLAASTYGQGDSTGTLGELNQLSLKEFVDRMDAAKLPAGTCRTAAAAWLSANDINSVSNLWLLGQVHRLLNLPEYPSESFSVCWTGSIHAPYDGDYTFSIYPISSCDAPDYQIGQRMSVWIGGQQVIQATESDWAPEAPAVSLRGGAGTPVRVEFSYESNRPTISDGYPAIAQLSWQGPGTIKQVVPASAFSSPDGAKAGLSVEYRLMARDQEQPLKTFTTSEPAIDHVWVEDVPIIPSYPELNAELAARITALAIAPDYLAQLEADPYARHILFGENLEAIRMLAMFTRQQREAIAETWIDHPSLLKEVPGAPIFAWYQLCRVHSPELALRLFTTWAWMNPEAEPRFCLELQKGEWNFYCAMANVMVLQCPKQIDLLEQHYLVRPDGGCCVPVAYVLGIGHVFQGRTEAWLEKLNAHLDNAQLGGDQRASWLLARAWLEEGRHTRVREGKFNMPIRQPLAGQQWLEEACLVAESEPVRLQAYKELVVRLAGEEQFDAARALLEKAASRCSLPASASKVAVWQQEVDEWKAFFAWLHERTARESEQAYWDEVRRRHQRAVDAGEEAAVSRYEQKMERAGVEP